MRTAGKILLLLCNFIGVATQAFEVDELESTILENASKLKNAPSLYIYCQNLTSVDCIEFRRFYFGRLKVLKQVDDDSAMIRVNVYERSLPNETELYGDWTLNRGNQLPLPNRTFSPLLDSDAIRAEVSTFVTQAVAAAIQIKSNAGLEELVLSSLNEEDPQSPTKTSPYYAVINLNGSASKSGMGSVNSDGTAGPTTSNSNAFASAALNRVTKKTRYTASFSGSYSNSSQPGPNGTTYSADNFAKSFDVLGVYSIDEKSKWNVALIASQNSNRGSNIKGKVHGIAAIEYNLVPFRIKQPYEFRVDVGVGYNDDRMVMPNTRGMTREQYLGLGAQLYGFWLLGQDQKASVTSSLSGRTIPSRKGYGSASLSTSLNYQVRRGIMVSTSASYSYVKRNINFPGSPDFSNPVATNYLSGYAGGNYFVSMGITFKIDNGQGGSILSIDRRFR